MAVGGILFILGLVPAMPQMLILPAAAIALGAGWQMRRMAALAVPAEEPAVPAADPHHNAWADVSEASACQLEVGYALIALVDERKGAPLMRAEEHTSELQSLMRISYAVILLQKKKQYNKHTCEQNKQFHS